MTLWLLTVLLSTVWLLLLTVLLSLLLLLLTLLLLPADSAVTHRTGKMSLESRLAEKREKQTAHLRKRDVLTSALGRVFGSLW